MPPLGSPLANSKFNLNSAGVAGFFGGEEVLSTIGIMHLYEGRRWFGWYNSPGSYTIAKHLGRMANSRFWDGLFPGPNELPAVVFGLDIKKGPVYNAALSRTAFPTGHLAHLTMERSKEVEAVEIEGRVTRRCDVAYLAMKHVDYDAPVKRIPFKDAPTGILPTTVSIATCIMCALVYDWLSFSMILIGIISNGWSTFVVGEGTLVITPAKNLAPGVPPGHGILMGEDEVVVIKGEERDVNAITKGRFDLETETKHWDEEKGTVRNYHAIGVCSLLLLLQFLLQLLLVPQGSLFGQVMFLVSLGASWTYNTYLSSLVKEKLQVNILFRTLGNPEMLRFRAGTRTTMAVFVCLLLFHGVERSSPVEDRILRVKIIRLLLPNDTAVWERWREKVVQQLLSINDGSDSFPYLVEDEEDRVLSESDRKLLRMLLEDASTALREYFRIRDTLPDYSSHQKVEVQ